MCQDALNEIGDTEVPDAFIGNANETAKQIVALAQREGRVLSTGHAWSVLQREHTFTTVASTESYALPSDWRYGVDETAWDRTQYWKMRGSFGAREWQIAKSGLIASTSLRKRFRVKWDTSAGAPRIFIDPVPASADSLVIEYVSTDWCESSGGTGQSAWAADTDVGRLDEELMRQGLVWRFLKAKGLPYEEEFNAYERQVFRAIETDVPSKVIGMGRSRPVRPTDVNLPESGYG